jgi:hypothetical protein
METVIEELRRALLQLPKVNVNVMKYLLKFLHEVQECSEDNKMTALNLATIFGPNFLRPQTADVRLLMECNTTCTDFVCIAIQQQWRLFPFTTDEKPPKRLSIVISSDDLSARWPDGGRLVQRSLYSPHDSLPHNKPGRPRRGSAPFQIASLDDSEVKSGVVASMVQQFNLRTTCSTSQLSNSPEISAPVAVCHTAGQKPGGAVLRSLLASNSASNLVTASQSTRESSLLSSEQGEVPSAAASSPQEKRFSGLGLLGPRSDTLSSDVIVNSISRELETLETQLAVMEEEAARYKKAARLWKARYKQERTARLAAEERVSGLQQLVDDTFQQFALEDSEDDSFGEPSSASDTGTPPYRTEDSA